MQQKAISWCPYTWELLILNYIKIHPKQNCQLLNSERFSPWLESWPRCCPQKILIFSNWYSQYACTHIIGGVLGVEKKGNALGEVFGVRCKESMVCFITFIVAYLSMYYKKTRWVAAAWLGSPYSRWLWTRHARIQTRACLAGTPHTSALPSGL